MKLSTLVARLIIVMGIGIIILKVKIDGKINSYRKSDDDDLFI